MACKICARFWARLWEKSDAWERTYASETGPWSDEPVRNLELIEQAYAVHKTDAAAAFRLFLEAAEAGSPWGMNAVAGYYWTGTAVAADFHWAQEFYRRAIDAGSWMATINYARLLEDHGYHHECESLLKDGMSRGFVPSYYWLALLRYQRCKSRKVLGEIRPMLEHAAEAGHPAAMGMLAKLMIRGKFGLRNVPAGFKWMWSSRPEAEFPCDRGVAGDTAAHA